ncbi:MAG: hypothetical protein LBB19_00705, partial [Puniceicoccales bacterium]|nr:hypothetical protein [Puniceicoccales bacterium]
MHWIRLKFFQSILNICLWSMGIVHGLAYTPPFSGKYVQGEIISYSTDGVWLNKMASLWGSNLKAFEKIHPGVMVDSTGTLYCVMPVTILYFDGASFVEKISPTGDRRRVAVYIDDGLGRDRYSWPSNRMNSFSEDANFSRIAWIPLAPCMAQEANGTTDYVCAIVYVLPSRWWNTASGPDTEGFLFLKIKKSDLSVVTSRLENGLNNSKAGGFGTFETTKYNQNVFTAIYDVGTAKIYVYWLHGDGAGNNKTKLHFHMISDQGQALVTWQCSYGSENDQYRHFIEPRITMVGDKYYFSTGNAYSPTILTASPSTGNTTHFANVPYMSTFDNHGTYGCAYHNDLNVIQHSGRTIVLQLAIGRSSTLGNSGGQWNTSYISWNTTYPALVLYSWPANLTWDSPIPIPTENCIAIFPITQLATTGYETSATTLYKNTHMFVTYNNHIIYAYCYPGKKTHLILGVARYKF